jgi:hypothetical protein
MIYDPRILRPPSDACAKHNRHSRDTYGLVGTSGVRSSWEFKAARKN